jgi:hypothetical protein
MSRPAGQVRAVGIASLVWGGLLLWRGDRVWRSLAGVPASGPQALAIQILAGRHLLEGLVQTVAPHRMLRLESVVDATHALTMLLLALQRGPSRRPALLSGAFALASAATTLAAVRRRP